MEERVIISKSTYDKLMSDQKVLSEFKKSKGTKSIVWIHNSEYHVIYHTSDVIDKLKEDEKQLRDTFKKIEICYAWCYLKLRRRSIRRLKKLSSYINPPTHYISLIKNKTIK